MPGLSKQNKMQGVLLIVMSGFFFSLMTLMVRLSGEVPVMQKSFFRNAIAAIIALTVLLRSDEGLHVNKENWKDLLARCILGTTGVICNFYAIDKIGLADSNMLNKLSPFFATAFSVFLLKEKTNRYEWMAIAIAFAGAMLIVKPSFDLTTIYSLIGLASGATAGAAYTFVRKLGKKGERGPVIVFCFSMFSCLVSLPFLIFDYYPMSLQQWIFLIMAGVFASGGQICITAAYTRAPAKEISVFDYVQILFATLLGIIFLKEIPDILSVTGYIIIIGVAFAKWRYLLNSD